MVVAKIRDLREYYAPVCIQVRVIKKWIPYQRPQELCYLFVHIEGDAIEAIADAKQQKHFDSVIKTQSCYNVSDYFVIASRDFMPVTSNKRSIRLGKRTNFTPVNNIDIPNHYFEFATYNMLLARSERPKKLTDLVGRVENIREPENKSGKLMRKLTMQDDSTNVLDVTFWGNKVSELEGKPIMGKIVALSSMLVTTFDGNVQLESTNASTATVEPPIPDLEGYITKFKGIPPKTQAKNKETKATIAEILDKNILGNKLLTTQSLTGNRFACEASITEIDLDHAWYYAQCGTCGKKAHLQLNSPSIFDCEDHKTNVPKIGYCVNAKIADETGNTKVVFFNEAMTTMLNVTCKDMIVTHGYHDPHGIPTEIFALRGIQFLMNITMQNTGTFYINRSTIITEISPNTPDPKSTTKTKNKQLHLQPDQTTPTKKTKGENKN